MLYGIGNICGDFSNYSRLENDRVERISNCYYLNTLPFSNNEKINSLEKLGPYYTMEAKSETEMKSRSFIELFNNNFEYYFKYDEAKINNGFPILLWQNSENNIAPEIVFEKDDIKIITKNNKKYVKFTQEETKETINSYMNKGKLAGIEPEYTNLTQKNTIKTGTEIKINGDVQYIIIIPGDVNWDGNITVRDLISANAIRGEEETANILKLLAADIDETSKVDLRDLISINSLRSI